MIADNLKSVTQSIAKCCEKIGKPPASVDLICVTKEASVDKIEEVLNLGLYTLGENRVQDTIIKYRVIGDRAIWHLIGHLQTNKVKEAVKIFSLIHSVDSIRLAKEIDREAKKINKIQDILVQVNVSGEASKFGCPPDKAEEILRDASLYPNINIKGLMSIAPEVDDAELARPYFRRLRDIFELIRSKNIENIEMQYLSMGMSNDFEVAIEEGSNMVRIGRAIFKDAK